MRKYYTLTSRKFSHMMIIFTTILLMFALSKECGDILAKLP